MDLSIIIVNFNTKALLEKCLRSVFNSHTTYTFEVLVSDNGSTDGSAEMLGSNFPRVRLFENGENLGFAKANNLAIRQSAARLALLLNSDTELRSDTLHLCIKYLDDHPEVGILGGKVILPDGSLDKACRRRFPNPKNAFLRLFGLSRYSDYNIAGPINLTSEVDAVMGAFLLIRRSLIYEIGLLDEDYFMYGEDLDWCYKAKQAGHKIVYYPKAEIVHYKYGSAQTIPFKTIRLAHTAMRIFYQKHYAQNHTWLFNQFVYLGISLRMLMVVLVNIFRKKKTVH